MTRDRRVESVLRRLSDTRRTFTEEEALADLWEAGEEVTVGLFGDLFALVAKTATGNEYRLTRHKLGNDLLLQRLISQEWDGDDVDAELAKLDLVHEGHHVFFTRDSRFVEMPNHKWQPTAGEVDSFLSDEVLAELDALKPSLLSRWEQEGGTPWTYRQVTAVLNDLGWLRADARSAWLSVQTWMMRSPEISRVAADFWIPATAVPAPPVRRRYQVISVRTSIASTESREPAGPAVQHVPLSDAITWEAGPPLMSSDLSSGVTPVSWGVTLRTVNVVEGFVGIPASKRGAFVGKPMGSGERHVIKGKWFDTGDDLWVWFDRTDGRLYGPDLAGQLSWCDAGQKLRIDWSNDVVVFRPAGIDLVVQAEEMRFIDTDALSALRRQNSESYLDSVVAILRGTNGLTFREIAEQVAIRQGHAANASTLRALLRAGSFDRDGERWSAGRATTHGKQRIRKAVATALIETEPQRPTELRTLAIQIQERLRQLRGRGENSG